MKIVVVKKIEKQNVISVSEGFLVKQVAEKEMLERVVNYFLTNDKVPDDVKEEVISLAGKDLIDAEKKPYIWAGL